MNVFNFRKFRQKRVQLIPDVGIFKIPETKTYYIDKISSEMAKYFLLSLTGADGVFGLEGYYEHNKCLQYFYTSQMSKPDFPLSATPKLMLSADINNISCFHVLFAKPSCFPFLMDHGFHFWNMISNQLHLESEKVFVQLLLHKKSDEWKDVVWQQYNDYLKGIDNPTSNKILRYIQFEMLEFINKVSGEKLENEQIVELKQKLLEDGFRFELRFVVFGDKERRIKIAKRMKYILSSLNFANYWHISEDSKKSLFMDNLSLRRFSISTSSQIVCTSELLPFMVTKYSDNIKQNETQIIPEIMTEQIIEESSNSFSIFPRGKKKIENHDIHFATNFNTALRKLNLISDTDVVIQKIINGATVQKVTFSLPNGLTLSNLINAKKNIQTELGLNDIGFEQGHEAGTASISIPQDERNIVYLGDCLDSEAYKKFIEKAELPFIVGVDSLGNLIMEDLVRIKHILITGTTGSGKSVFLTILLFILTLVKNPKDLQLVLIDPKKVELSNFKKYQHIIELITDMDEAAEKLEGIVDLMDKRYEIFEQKEYKNIQQYNKNEKDKIPYIVIAVDEFADLMSTNSEIENYIIRLAQKARAAGIHLILGTQYPIKEVITSLIKRNIVSRVCFALDSGTAYRTALDEVPPFTLLGKGDGVYRFEGIQGLHRFQSPIISTDDDEQDKIIKHFSGYWKGDFKHETIPVKEKKSDLDNIKIVIAETCETRISAIQKILKIRTEKVQECFTQLVEEKWLSPPVSKKTGYGLLLSEDERKQYLQQLR